MSAPKLTWFNERSQPIPQPGPWQTAHLEISGIPAHYAWQNLRLHTQTLSTQASPLYLKKRNKNGLHLHADWAAAEPGIHHLRLYLQQATHLHLLWETHFFLEAPPLTEALWLRILQDTYQQSHLRFRPQTPVPFAPQTTQSDPFISSPERVYESRAHALMVHEFHALFALLCGPYNLAKSLRQLPFEDTWQWKPLYRTRRVSPTLLFRNPAALAPHTAVPEQKRLPTTPLAGYVHFLLQALLSRLQFVAYALPQVLKKHPFLIEPLQQMQRQGTLLRRAWQQHPYAQTVPRWNAQALTELSEGATHTPALTAWVNCAQLLFLRIRPELAVQTLFVGYQSFAYVYQQWCSLQLKEALHTALQKRGWQILPTSHPETRSWVHSTGEHLVLHTEQRFSPAHQTTETSFSISRGQQPDLCLLWFKDTHNAIHNRPHKGLVFEIKFRQEALRPRKGDLDRLHAYRDAIYTQHGTEAFPLFVGGALLYPGHNEDYPPGLQALTCLPTHELRLEYLLTQLLGAFL